MPSIQIHQTNPNPVFYTNAHPPTFTSPLAEPFQSVPSNLVGIAPAGSQYNASASSVFMISPGDTFDEMRAFDGNLNTYWKSNDNYSLQTGNTTSTSSFNSTIGEWIRLDFPTNYSDTITHIVLSSVNNKHWILYGVLPNNTIITAYDSRTVATPITTEPVTYQITPSTYKAFVLVVTAVYGVNDVFGTTLSESNFNFASCRVLQFLNGASIQKTVTYPVELQHGHFHNQDIVISEIQTIHSNTNNTLVNELEVYPPVAMEGAGLDPLVKTTNVQHFYGGGTYVVSTAALNTTAGAINLIADKNSTTRIRSGTNLYSTSNGQYLGGRTTSGFDGVTTNVYSGEWYQFQLPKRILLKSFFLRSRATDFALPKNVAVFGSNNGSTWILLKQLETFLNDPNISQQVYDISATIPYSYFRFVVLTSYHTSLTYIEINEIELYAQPTGNLRPYPQRALPVVTTGNPTVQTTTLPYVYGSYDDGTYVVRSSNTTGGSSGGFTYQPNALCDKSTATAWRSINAYSASLPNPTVAASTVTDLGTVLGEWVQIQLPKAILLDSVLFRHISSSGTPRASLMVLLGSTNGSSWTTLPVIIASTTYTEVPTSGIVFNHFKINDPVQPFSYFRFIVTKTNGAGYTQIHEMELYEKPTISETTVLSSHANQIQVTTPSLSQHTPEHTTQFFLHQPNFTYVQPYVTAPLNNIHHFKPNTSLATIPFNTRSFPLQITYVKDQFPYILQLPLDLNVHLFIDSQYM
jgi:hypothetical protein